jgi:hypothetical protein
MTQRTWRTLIRVIAVDHIKNIISVVVPGWHYGTVVHLPFNNIPVNVQKLAVPEKRFHAKVNIGTPLVEDLTFSDWETE